MINNTIFKAQHFLFNARRSGSALSFFRVGTAMIGLLYVIVVNKDFLTLYGNEGIVSNEINDALIGNNTPRLNWITSFLFSSFNISEIDALRLIKAFYIVILILLALGVFSNYVAFLCWALNFCICSSAYLMQYGYDSIMNNCLLLCILMPVGHHFSIDNILRKKKSAIKLEAFESLSVRIIQFHLCIIYFMSGINKAKGVEWWNGEAIWRSVMQPPLKSYDFSWMANFETLPIFMGWTVLIIEMGYPFMIWSSRFGKFWLISTICMHIGIAIIMNLQFFGLIMIIMNIAAFGFKHQLLKKVLINNSRN